MAKSITTSKRDNEKKKNQKREEKQKKKESRKLSGTNSFDDMIAYVDQNGRITSTPPSENFKKEEIDIESIVISTPKKIEEEPTPLRGRVEYFNEAKGFGFIKNLSEVDKYFFHINNVIDEIIVGNIVTFTLEKGLKGINAVDVCLAPAVEPKPAAAPKPVTEPKPVVEPETAVEPE